nr:importin-5-like [Tanacetum cinerariifolium]
VLPGGFRGRGTWDVVGKVGEWIWYEGVQASLLDFLRKMLVDPAFATDFQSCVDIILFGTINGGQKAAAQEALDLLIGLAVTELRFWGRQLVEVVGKKNSMWVCDAKDKKLRVKELLKGQPRFSISQSGSLPMVKGQKAAAQEALDLLIGLAGTELRFWGRQLVEVVGSMLQIMEAKS